MNYYEKLQELERKKIKIIQKMSRLNIEIENNKEEIREIQAEINKKNLELEHLNRVNKELLTSSIELYHEKIKSSPLHLKILYYITLFTIGYITSYLLLLFTSNIIMNTIATLVTTSTIVGTGLYANKKISNKIIKNKLQKKYGIDNIKGIKKNLFSEIKNLRIQMEQKQQKIKKDTIYRDKLEKQSISCHNSIKEISKLSNTILNRELIKIEYPKTTKDNNKGRSRRLTQQKKQNNF